ncbi:hypothetical protein VTO42DRAFT_616 [Malbranchea cinnamomea]
MSSSQPRKSVESLRSASSATSLSQLPFSQFDSSVPRRPKYASRRGSTASSISIGARSLSTLYNDSIAELGTNAISTLLQPPIVRTGLVAHTSVPASGYKPPTSRDIPPVTLTNVPHVDSNHFQPYLSQVGSLYDVLHSAKEAADQNDRHESRKATEHEKFADLDTSIPPQINRRLSEVSLGSQDYRGQRIASSVSYKGRSHSATPLSTVPSVYFEENFQLENPRTFDIVSERSDVIPSSTKPSDAESDGTVTQQTRRKALATNAILLEKLSWYLDTIEIHLISAISTASTSFFTAMGSLRELHAEAAASVQKIRALRGDLAKLDNEMALGGLKVVKLRRRQENVRKLAEAVSQLEEVLTSVTQCEELVNEGHIDSAIDVLDDVERLIAGEQPIRPRQHLGRIIDLRGIKALEGASADLGHLRYRIGTGYERRFLDVLIEDLRRHVASVPPNVTLLRLGETFQRSRGSQRSSQTNMPSYMHTDDQMRRRLRLELAGLGRSRHTMPAATAFKSAVVRELKSLIRRHLPSSSDDDNESVMSASTHGGRQLSQQEKSAILARNLRAMEPEDAHSMLTKIYTGVSEALRRLSIQVKVLLDITSDVGSPSRSQSMQNLDAMVTSGSTAAIVKEEISQVLDMSSLLGHAVDVVQSQIAKVLKVRAEQTENLPLSHFLRYFSLNRLFANECEAISGQSGAALKTVVDSQIKGFISNFGDGQRHRLVQIMDSDRWDAKDFGEDENVLLSRILDASTKDVDVWGATSRIWTSTEDTDAKTQNNGSVANGIGVANGGKDRIRSAIVDEQKYILPESALAILRVIEKYLHLIAGIPSMSADIGLSLLECLKLFNSRSSQLILGAGATRSAGLKNITTKHLALASQALSFVIAIIPYAREFVRRHCASNNVIAEFDRVKRLYQEHQSGIHEKLVDIMSSRAAVHVNSMKKIDWEAGRDSTSVSPYMEILAKETGTLHRVLAKHLPELTVKMIMDPVFASYKEQWSVAFQSISLKSESARQRLISDVEYFKSKMEKIDGATDLTDHLLGIINAKAITATPGADAGSESSQPRTTTSPAYSPDQ